MANSKETAAAKKAKMTKFQQILTLSQINNSPVIQLKQ
jgi:hypothetical protein